MFAILVHELAEAELGRLGASLRRTILDRIVKSLQHEPTVPSRHRKQLRPCVPSFEALPPIWELRVGNHRVFYDVDNDERVVNVRAVRYKGNRRTEDIL